MRRGIARASRTGAALCLMLMIAGAATASAQTTMDPAFDSDGDGISNNMDFDDDNDGIADNIDCAPFDPSFGQECPPPAAGSETGQQIPVNPAPAPPVTNPAPGNDNDGDGIDDAFDPDDDNDGITDEYDAAPFDPAVGEPPPVSIIDRQVDSDGDGIANSHDPDDDNDGVQDDQDSHPFDPTRGEKPGPSIISPDHDSDGDGIANSHDPDDDNDGVVDELDCAPFDATITSCDDAAPTPTPTPTNGQPAPGGGSADPPYSGRRGVGSGAALLVTTLPNTGVGDGLTRPVDDASAGQFLAAFGLALVALGSATGMARRRSR